MAVAQCVVPFLLTLNMSSLYLVSERGSAAIKIRCFNLVLHKLKQKIVVVE